MAIAIQWINVIIKSSWGGVSSSIKSSWITLLVETRLLAVQVSQKKFSQPKVSQQPCTAKREKNSWAFASLVTYYQVPIDVTAGRPGVNWGNTHMCTHTHATCDAHRIDNVSSTSAIASWGQGIKESCVRSGRFQVSSILVAITTFMNARRKPSNTSKGQYTLKPELEKQFNPFFYHYSKVQLSKVPSTVIYNYFHGFL